MDDSSCRMDVGLSCFTETSLRLNSSGFVGVVPELYEGGSSKRKLNEISLDLDLGYSRSSNLSDPGMLETLSLDLNLSLGTKRPCNDIKQSRTEIEDGNEKLRVDLELSLLTGSVESDLTSVGIEQFVDEGSTSSKWKQGGLVSLVEINDPGTSVSEQERRNKVKTCQFPGCRKVARGASGRCISHGGGRRCQRSDCQKGAEGKTDFCKAHGGGRRCEHLGCSKSAGGRTNLCIAHGGGRRCTYLEGCTRAARGKSGLCIRHGGGKRCKLENCTRSAEGVSGLCIAHGGGRRCEYPHCTKGSQGSTKLCKAHGGGKRCIFPECTKGAEGSTLLCKRHGGGKRCTYQGGGVCTKSVHGGTLFCVSHGGGKRCKTLGCTKSARGRTEFCVRHGGGKRCKFEGCGKSAQGRTDFCKAHGGGMRCLWGQPGSSLGEDGSVEHCDKFARGKTGFCVAHAAQVQDKRVHGNGTVGLNIKETATETLIKPANDDIVEGNSSHWNGFAYWGYEHDMMALETALPKDGPLISTTGESSYSASLPEGRVHGGALMAMLRGN
ncbi:uncharacterized protein LOC141656665 [Silene latifolia]|uniref:uncharacterized protein LOC141656665 n=1 Tax=Silene latifolia TaxID=37657 RepID=UPI003D780291